MTPADVKLSRPQYAKIVMKWVPFDLRKYPTVACTWNASRPYARTTSLRIGDGCVPSGAPLSMTIGLRSRSSHPGGEVSGNRCKSLRRRRMRECRIR